MIEQSELNNVSFYEKHSKSIRAWHWLTFVIVTLLLLTVLLNYNILDSTINAPLFKKILSQSGTIINDKQARHLAKTIENKIWTWHKYFGITLSFLMLFRLISEFVQPKNQKIFVKLKKSFDLYRKKDINNDKVLIKHYLGVKSIYLIFYILITIMVVTGLILTYEDDYSFLQTFSGIARTIHEYNMYLILTFVIIHIGGVIISELGKFKGIVSNMINGGK
ncbi:MAG: cytochrome b/b6 domain-containing protein [Candidatus Sericytochromatia bacterium]|nr:cytochrome b/b6 domain-containing protein [Candidatus Sericytochromatia bacterium]